MHGYEDGPTVRKVDPSVSYGAHYTPPPPFLQAPALICYPRAHLQLRGPREEAGSSHGCEPAVMRAPQAVSQGSSHGCEPAVMRAPQAVSQGAPDPRAPLRNQRAAANPTAAACSGADGSGQVRTGAFSLATQAASSCRLSRVRASEGVRALLRSLPPLLLALPPPPAAAAAAAPATPASWISASVTEKMRKTRAHSATAEGGPRTVKFSHGGRLPPHCHGSTGSVQQDEGGLPAVLIRGAPSTTHESELDQHARRQRPEVGEEEGRVDVKGHHDGPHCTQTVKSWPGSSTRPLHV
jgi:hypothetical protein